jgi:hypothetical protein
MDGNKPGAQFKDDGMVHAAYPPSFRKLVLILATLACTGAIATARPPAADAQRCVGDCDGDREVTIDELIAGINDALGGEEACLTFDWDDDGHVTVDELIIAVNEALDGCPDLLLITEPRDGAVIPTGITAVSISVPGPAVFVNSIRVEADGVAVTGAFTYSAGADPIRLADLPPILIYSFGGGLLTGEILLGEGRHVLEVWSEIGALRFETVHVAVYFTSAAPATTSE